MKYMIVEPLAPAEFGSRSVLEHRPDRLIVHHPHLLVKGWLGDELWTSIRYYFISESLAEQMRRAGITGFRTGEVDVEPDFDDEADLGIQLPQMLELIVDGALEQDDLVLAPDRRLLVSVRAWATIQPRAPHSRVRDWPER